MPHRPSPATRTAHPGAFGRAWMGLRSVLMWLLLCTLLFDAATSPLHAHEHDGVPPPFESGIVWSAGQAHEVRIHTPDADHHHAGHPTLALRGSVRGLSLEAPPASGADEAWAPPPTPPFLTPPARHADAPTPRTALAPPPSHHRGLSPAVRAPPAQA